MTERAIYLHELKAYNNGKLHGQWFTVSDYADADELNKAIEAFLKASPEHSESLPCEEWRIDDHEGFYTGFDPSCLSFDELIELSENDDATILEMLIAEGIASDLADAEMKKEEVIHADSFRQYAENILEDTLDIPDYLTNYIDYEMWARDLEMDYSVFDCPEGGVYIIHCSV